MKKEIEVNENMLEGRNAVTEALKAGRTIDKVFLASGDTDSTLRYIASLAKKNGAVVTYCDRRKLDTMTQTGAHQGVIAMAAARDYATIQDILDSAREKGEAPLIIICDEITDPHNLGAIIRRVCRRPWSHYSQAPQLRTDRRGGKGFCWCHGVYENCPGQQFDCGD